MSDIFPLGSLALTLGIPTPSTFSMILLASCFTFSCRANLILLIFAFAELSTDMVFPTSSPGTAALNSLAFLTGTAFSHSTNTLPLPISLFLCICSVDIPATIDHNTLIINTAVIDVEMGMNVGMIVNSFYQICDVGTHYELCNNLIEHLWHLKGEVDDQ